MFWEGAKGINSESFSRHHLALVAVVRLNVLFQRGFDDRVCFNLLIMASFLL